MPKLETNTQLKTQVNELRDRVIILQTTIGLIRQEVSKITVPYDHVDSLQESIKIIDRIIDRS